MRHLDLRRSSTRLAVGASFVLLRIVRGVHAAEMRHRALVIRSVIGVGLFLSWMGVASAADVFDERGFQTNRDFFSQLPYEHIDPLTGNLLLTFTDLVLPGNGGFDLRIQRSYNSKIYKDYNTGQTALDEDSWAGVGWTLHLGRVFNVNSIDLAKPIVEMPDGSQHRTYTHVSPPAGCGSCYVTRDHWTYDRNTNTLKMPNGLVYTFGQPATIGGRSVRYATQITDSFGNSVNATYGSIPGQILTITQNLGSAQARTITFGGPGPFGNLTSMTYSTGTATYTWNYAHQVTDAAAFSILTSVAPPVGPSWSYGYNTVTAPKWELTSVTTPSSGTISYGYLPFESHLGSTAIVKFRGISSRTTSGPNIASGTWNFAYGQGSGDNQSTITSPCGITTTYTFLGVGNQTSAPSWQIGLPSAKSVSDATVTRTESFAWRTPAFADRISNDDEFVGFNTATTEIYVPLLQSQSISLGVQSFQTAFGYSSANFNDYGQANSITETGDLGTRTTTRAFQHSFTPYIRGRLTSETVTVGGEPFSRSWSYTSTNGFRNSETIYGITTTFAPDALGNVRSATNANVHTTTYSYSWGRVKDTTTPSFVINRGINPEGTLQSETRRGFVTSYTYDGLFRLLTKTPPTGDPWVTAYDNSAGAWTRVTRGASSVMTSLDGFGRSLGASDTQGVKTGLGYDACGRQSYVSYPFVGTNNIGTSFSYDALGRVKAKTNPDGFSARYAYTGIDVTITDENGRATAQNWAAFGDPNEPRLLSVTDAAGKLTQYAYNAVGSLKQVIPPAGGTRTWTYYGTSEVGGTPGLLKTETHPESGMVTYTYFPAGNLKTRTDARGQLTTYGYDANERLTSVDRVGTDYDTTLGYDASDNRTLLQNLYVTSTFAFDGANRPTMRTDIARSGIAADRTLTTNYVYWPSDALRWIDYPSGKRVYNTYDSENRISSVANGQTPTVVYGNAFTYHPSGAILSFKPGGASSPNAPQTFTYHPQRYWLTGINTGLRNLTYDYTSDRVGNVRGITDSRPGMNRSFSYDTLDRLATATGFWGPGTYSFTYDDIGNRTNDPVTGSSAWSYTSNRLISAGSAGSFAYDNNGNVTSDGSRTYSYTPENMLQSATVGSATTTYRYDGDNLRTLKIDSGGARYFVHGPGDQILSEFVDTCSGTSATNVRDYVYAGQRLIASVEPTVATLSLSGPLTVQESDGTATFIVTLHKPGPLAQPVTFTYSASGSGISKIAGAAGRFEVTDPDGATYPINVSITSNFLPEADKPFVVQIYNGCNATITTGTQSTMIEDDDATVAFTVSSSSVPENAGPSVVTVQLTTSHGKPTQNAVSVSYGTSNGIATAGIDYTAASGVLTWAVNTASGPSSARSITIPILSDSANECDETFAVNLTSPSGGALGQAQHTVTIIDGNPPTISFAGDPLPVLEGNSGTTLVDFTVNVASHCQAVSVKVSPGGATDTAIGGVDYDATQIALSFPVGTSSGHAFVPVFGDTVDEPNEGFTVRLTEPVGATVGSPDRAQVVISDDDGLPATCDPILYVPFRITAQGNYCLRANLSTAMLAGNAITIETDFVTVDLKGFKIGGGSAGFGTQANGIYALNHRNITIKNGNIRGFYRAVFLEDTSGTFSLSQGHLVQNVRADENTFAGIHVQGSGNAIRGNQIVTTGGSTVFGANADAYGIRTEGPGIRILNNDIVDANSAGSGSGIGISVTQGTGGVAEKNRVGSSILNNSYGIKAVSGSDVLMVGNRVAKTAFGIFYGTATGRYRDNLTTGVTTPYTGGTDAGNNQ